MLAKNTKILLAGLMLSVAGGIVSAADAPASASAAAPDVQKQLDALKAAIPKFAIPMREVGDRFQNMYFAAKNGNWALAAYMSKYMDGAMNPAKLTKPDEYKTWANFYSTEFAPVQKAIMAKDFKAFDKAYMAVIQNCNDCHQGMGYGFIKVTKLKAPANQGILYTGKSEPTDVPK